MGVGLEVLVKVKWCYQRRWVFVKVLSGGEEMASPLEIGEGAPLELEGGRAGLGGGVWVGSTLGDRCNLGVEMW